MLGNSNQALKILSAASAMLPVMLRAAVDRGIIKATDTVSSALATLTSLNEEYQLLINPNKGSFLKKCDRCGVLSPSLWIQPDGSNWCQLCKVDNEQPREDARVDGDDVGRDQVRPTDEGSR